MNTKYMPQPIDRCVYDCATLAFPCPSVYDCATLHHLSVPLDNSVYDCATLDECYGIYDCVTPYVVFPLIPSNPYNMFYEEGSIILVYAWHRF